MKHFKIFLTVIFSAGVLIASAQTGKQLFPQQPGIVSYTYRDQFAKDVPATLDLIVKNGISDIEFSNLFGKTAVYLRQQMDVRGLKCSSFGVSYNDLMSKTDTVAINAKILNAQYVRVAGVPHTGAFTLADAQNGVKALDSAGKVLHDKYGLILIYHNHGFEFQPYGDGTLYDYMVQHTNPGYVSLELDILWAYFPGQDPAALLNKYGIRYKAIHLKDLKKGVKGNLSGGTAQDNDVVLGTGQINLKAVLIAAKKAGVSHYYIEDESTHSVKQVPQSIAYLKNLKE